MTVGVAIVDRDIAPGEVRPWVDENAALGLLSAADAPPIVEWARERELDEVIVACRARDAAGARLAATVLVGARPRTTATVVASGHGSLALAAAAAAALWNVASANEAYARFLGCLERSRSGALLRRVTRLDDPPPTVWQHLASVFGRDHVVWLGDDPRVVRASPVAGEIAGEVSGEVAGTELLVGADPASGELARVSAVIGGGAQAHPLPPIVPPEAAFGSPGSEFALLVPVSSLPSLGTATCRVCGGPVLTAACPMCRVRQRAGSAA